MYNAGLILEGGGMRGVYTAGVLDAFLDAGIEFSSVYGVSAGSCHACSYLSKQRGRAFRVNVDYLDDPNYCGAKTFLKTGNVFGPEMLYEQIPDVLDPFDHQAFLNYPGKFYAVVTDVETGAARYLRVRDLRKQMWMIRSSSSLPLVSKTIVVKGHKISQENENKSIYSSVMNYSIDSEDIERTNANSVYDLLGTIPGVQRSGNQIRIRGNTRPPVVVVDDVMYDAPVDAVSYTHLTLPTTERG